MEFGKVFGSIDVHVAGEAYRLVTQSPIRLKLAGIQEQAQELKEGFSDEKNLLLNEPRGHRGMHGLIAVGSTEADTGAVVLHSQASQRIQIRGGIGGTGCVIGDGGAA